MGRTLRLVCAIALATGACTHPVLSPDGKGAAPAISILAGRWSGEYETKAGSDEHGTLAFELKADSNHAQGPIAITPAGGQGPYAAAPETNIVAPPEAREAQPLSIRFLAASDGLLYGDVDQYLDTTRASEGITTLRADLRGDHLVGTFRTTYANGAETSGEWQASRVASQ